MERRLARLTDRERAVLERLARGRRAQSIAEEFGVSLATTRTQIRAVLHKLEVNGQLEAVALLNEHRRATQATDAAVRPADRRYSAVRILGPSAVTAIVCSAWAARLPSAVRSVQPSASWQ